MSSIKATYAFTQFNNINNLIRTQVFEQVMQLVRPDGESNPYTDLVRNRNFIILSIAFIDHFGLIGITYSYLLNYTLYLVIVFFIIKNKWKTIQT